MRILLYLMLSVVVAAVLPSCINDDITDSPTARLAFSTDTLSLDTVFTDVGTPTARLIVFNRNKKGVNISSIRFRNPDTRFRMNVDGVSSETFHDVEIRGGDSIYVFIECHLPENHSHDPELYADELEFQINGMVQDVRVEAWGQNVTRLQNLRVEEDLTLDARQPYVVFDSLTVAPGATLRIEPGTRLLFHDKASLVVEGTLEAVGEPGSIIQMRGDRTGNILTDVSYDLMSGQWQGVRIAPESFGNRLEYVDMRATVSGLRLDSCDNTDDLKLLLRNCWLHNSQNSVFTSSHSRVEAVGVCFSEAPRAVVSLTGGKIDFTQCTISNYYLFSAITEPLLCLYHCMPEDLEVSQVPLMEGVFRNSIIYGMGADINIGDLAGSNVFFQYVLFKSEGSDDSNFQNCIWNEDPLFYTDRAKYIFDYRLRPDSPAIGAGDPAYVSVMALTDYFGLNRLMGSAPDLGAFVFVQPTEEPGLTSP